MGKCFYKPPIMVDYRKCFSAVNHFCFYKVNTKELLRKE